MLRARCQYANHKQASKALPLIVAIFLTLSLNACHTKGSFFSEDAVPFPFDQQQVKRIADSTMQSQKGWMYADTYTRPYYQQETPQWLWASELGLDDRIDTLLNYLRTVEEYGLKQSSFHVAELEKNLQAFRKLKPDSCTLGEVCQLQGKLEYLATEAYMRYAYGQRYGYVRPHKLFNNLLPDTPAAEKNNEKRFRHIFDIRCDQPSDSLFGEAAKALSSAEDLSEFLQDIQPQNALYHQLKQAWQEALAKKDEERKRLCAINLERSRWRYEHPSGNKYVWVNLADFMLTAVNQDLDSVMTMKVCGGDMKHKTPLLYSAITRLDLNPYWIIPSTIIHNELIPLHLKDSSYYSRNNIVAIDKKTKAERKPWELSAAQLKSGQYTLRQEKGAGNSLGRMIFRFPNDFAIFLHDTNNPSAFSKKVRAVSHGCIRLQRPLDLAIFLMDDPDELTIDRIRIAIDKQPLSEKGKKLKAEEPDYEGAKNHAYKPSIPVFLDYYTLYPDAKTKELTSHPDNYGYDKEIERILKQF